MKFCLKLSLLFSAVLMAATTARAADISISNSGSGRFSINGANMNGVAAMDLAITYNSNLLSSPAVFQGGLIAGAMIATNTNVPGSIRVAVVSTKSFTGAGQILGLNFSGGGGAEAITSLSAKLIDLNGAPIQARTSIIPDPQTATSSPFSPFFQESTTNTQTQTQTQSTATTAKTVATTTTAPSIGTITLPDEMKQTESAKKQDQPAIEAPPQERYQPPPATTARAEETRAAEAKTKAVEKKREEIKMVGYAAVIDRFKAFKGERNLAALADLFTRPVADDARQEPALAVCDGKQAVRILAGFPAQDDDAAPNFATKDAKVLSLKVEDGSGRWLIDLLPAKDAMTASVTILLGNRLYELPLVTVPATRALTFSEQEITAFLKDFNADKPEYDLNSDGRHDYLDDYIYTGHYLLRPRTEKSP